MPLTYCDDRGGVVGKVGFAAAQLQVRHIDVAAGRPVPGALVLGRDGCGSELAKHLSAATGDALRAGVQGGFVGVAGYEVSSVQVEDVAHRLAERIDARGDAEGPQDPPPTRRYGGPLGGQEEYEFPVSLPGVPADAGLRRVHIRQAFGAEIHQYVEWCWYPPPRPPRGWRFWQSQPRGWPDWDHLKQQAEKFGATGPWMVLGGGGSDGSLTLRSVDLLDCEDRNAAEVGFAATVARVLAAQGH